MYGSEKNFVAISLITNHRLTGPGIDQNVSGALTNARGDISKKMIHLPPPPPAAAAA